MTISRLWQSGAELGVAEFHSYNTQLIQTTGGRTGTYCFRAGANTSANGFVLVPATRQLRVGWAGYTNGTDYDDEIFSIRGANFPSQYATHWNHSPAVNMRFYVNGSLQYTATGLWPKSDYVHFGVDLKIDPSAGWCYVYIEGVQVLGFTGNTGNFDARMVSWGTAPNSGNSPNSSFYLDDLWIDDSTGEGAPAACEDRRFLLVMPDGNGTYSDGVGSDADSTDNYLLVDDTTADGATTEVVLDAVDEKDTYTMANPTLPANAVIQAVCPVALVHKGNASVGTQVKFLARESATDAESAALDLPGDYASKYTMARFATKPSGGSWDATAVNAMEIGIKSAGSFS